MATIGFIGLGNMGGPMAANLVRAGHEIQGFDLMPAALATATANGIRVVSSAAEAADGAELVVTMLPSGKHVLEIFRDPAGPLPVSTAGTLFIDSSTIDVASAREAASLVASAGRCFIDAPVSGGVGGAAAGTLTFMAGGSEDDFARAKPVLEAMGRKIVHCGGPGSGQAAKICNNMILGISMIAVSEAFVLAEQLGLSREALFDVASTSSGQCWSLTSYCPVPGPVPTSPANNDYRPGFATALMLKDMRLAIESAAAAGAPVALGNHAREIYEGFAAAGNGNVDFSGIIQEIRAKATKPAA